MAFGRGFGFASGGHWGQLDPGWILQLEGEAIEDDGLSLEVSDVELEAAAGETTPCSDIPCGAYRQCFGLVLRQ